MFSNSIVSPGDQLLAKDLTTFGTRLVGKSKTARSLKEALGVILTNLAYSS